MNQSKETLAGLNRKKDLICFSIAFILLAVLLLWKARYGFSYRDESFYLTIPYRLCQGDKLFLHEWHLSLMSGYLLLPLMKLYLTITKGATDGMLLTFRCFYVAAQLLSTAYLYFALRKISRPGALIACCFYAVYAPYCISALSYNSMGIIFLVTALVLFNTTSRKPLFFLAGILYANAVLCCPYLAVLWFFAGAAVLFLKDRTLRVGFLWGTLGVAMAAAVFLIYVFSQITFSEFLTVMPYVLTDESHQTSVLYKLYTYVTAILFDGPATPYICIAYVIILAVGLIFKKQAVKQWCLFGAIVVTIWYLAVMVSYHRYLNHLLLPVNFTAFICYALFPKKNLSRLFYGVWFPGMVYTVCLHFSSNQVLYSITSASAVPMVASIIIVWVTAQEECRSCETRLPRIAVTCALVFMLAVQGYNEVYLRINAIFGDSSITGQTVQVTEGPEAGLLASKSANKHYSLTLADLDIPDGNVLFFSSDTWLYLCGGWRNAAYSAWLTDEFNDATIEKLENYYRINLDKMPDYIFVDAELADFTDAFTQGWGYEVISTYESGNALLARQPG